MSPESGRADIGVSASVRLKVQPPSWDDLSSGEDSDQEDDERPLTREELKRKTLRSGVALGAGAGTSVVGGGAGIASGSGAASVDNKAKDVKVMSPTRVSIIAFDRSGDLWSLRRGSLRHAQLPKIFNDTWCS